MVSLLAFVAQHFEVQIPDDAVVPEHFETPQALADLIAALQDTQPVSAITREPHHVLSDAIALLESSGIQRDTVTLASGEHMHTLRVNGAAPTWVLFARLGQSIDLLGRYTALACRGTSRDGRRFCRFWPVDLPSDLPDIYRPSPQPGGALGYRCNTTLRPDWQLG